MFAGFSLEDFEQFASERAVSNVFNRQRLLIKENVLELARVCEPLLAAAGMSVELGSTDHTPSLKNARHVENQWAYFARTGEERALVQEILEGSRGLARLLVEPAPHARHAALVVGIDREAVSIAVRLCAGALVDSANLRSLLAAEEGRTRLLGALATLGAAFTLAAPGCAPIPAPAADSAAIDAFLAAFPEDGDGWLVVGRELPRAEAAAAGSGLAGIARDSVAALLDVHRIVSWSRENDHIAFDSLVERVRAEHAHEEVEHDRAHRAFEERKEESQAAARERTSRMLAEWGPSKTRGGTREVVLPRWAPVARPRKPAAQPEPAEPDPGARTAPERPDAGRPPAAATPPAQAPRAAPPAGEHAPAGRRQSQARREEGDSPWTRGNLVRILRGPLRGRVGTFFESDSHGNARIMLGLLTTRLSLDDLRPVGPRP